MFVIMMGFTFFSASMWVGLTLANGLTAGRFFWAEAPATATRKTTNRK